MSKLATHPGAVMSLAVGFNLSARASDAPATLSLEGPLRAVYAEHFPMVFRTLRRLGVREPELEDAVQDVFIVLYRRWSEFEGRSSLKTWLYGIVLRVAKDYRRSELRRVRRIQGLSDTLGMQPWPNSPDEEAERREARRLIHAVLATLRDEQREVLVLVELEQLSVRQAAAALGLHVRACQRRLRAAHHALETALVAHSEHPRSSNR